jgi:hypothetical protein
MTEDEIAVKFNALGRDVVGEPKCEELRKVVMNIDREPRLDRLFKLMTR